MRNLIIFGDSQFAERISKYIILEGKDNFVAFTQEKKFISKNKINGYPVVPFEDLKLEYSSNFEIILGIGYSQMNNLRKKIYQMCISKGYKVATYISCNSIIYSDNIGEGTIICPGVIIGPDCSIGIGNFIESSVVLSHDNQLGDFNFLSSAVVLGGFAKLEDKCFLGLNSTVKDNVTIVSENLIGSAANVIHTISKKGDVYIGNPAKILLTKTSKNAKI